MERPVVVVKVGTSTLVSHEEGGMEYLDAESFDRIGRQINQLRMSEREVVLVSSAAITAGMIRTGTKQRPDDIAERQWLSAMGWMPIVGAWEKAIGEPVGSAQLTKNSLQTEGDEMDKFGALLQRTFEHGNVLVVNENDAIASDEIKFGDNDTLSATAAVRIKKLGAESVSLVMLSDVDGVYRDKNDPNTRIPYINDIDEYAPLAAGPGSTNGTGGMQTKFAAARLATKAGVPTHIAHGRRENAIIDALNGQTGTKFTL